jgi:ribonuclease VapC
MVVDSSALLAILLLEPEADLLARRIVDDPRRLAGVVTALETAIVIECRKGPPGGREFDLLLHRAGIQVVPLDVDQLQLAREAYLRFGKGRHPAGLNMGDCCSYALSRSSGEPLLFKGNDFSQTDVSAVGY